MGQKTSPVIFRLGIIKDWSSVWFAERDYDKLVFQDKKIRDLIQKEYKKAGISNIGIKRKNSSTEVSIKAARPGIIIGRGGEEAEKLKKLVKRCCNSI